MLVIVYLATFSMLTGCSTKNSQEAHTVEVLQEQVRDRDQQISSLKTHLEQQKQEIEALKLSMKKDFVDHDTEVKRLHRVELAQMETLITAQREELNKVHRELPVLRKMVDDPQIMERGLSWWLGYALVGTAILLLIIATVCTHQINHNRSLRRQQSQLVLEEAKQLQLLKGVR